MNLAINKPWRAAYAARTDLQQFGDNALGLFALGLKFRIDDLVTVATDSITDGSDDKKCDIVHINLDDGYAVVAQCYLSTNEEKQSAPSNKASDLNTAVTWLLTRPLAELPEIIRPAAGELRTNIDNGRIRDIHFLYIHNLPESQNVKSELLGVEGSARSALSTYLNKELTGEINIHAEEIGANTFEELYQDTQSTILVDGEFEIKISGGYETKGPNWKAFNTTLGGEFLYNLYQNHSTKLFSANVRDYLGSRSADSNINHGITTSAETEPSNFWVYNNGLTLIVNSYEEIEKNNERFLLVSGVSIVNGAQTTGALGNLKDVPADVAVSARFVNTSNNDLVEQIIKNNNSQNSVTAADFRSTDAIQRRLKKEISEIPDAEYEGGRRGGASARIQRRPNLLPSYTVGQALSALHGEPVIAYNNKSEIWVNDSLYTKIFHAGTTGKHLVFGYGLLRAVETQKNTLVEKSNNKETLTEQENKQLDFLRRRGSTYVLVSAIAASLETILDRPVPNRFRLSFGSKVTPKKAEELWGKIVELALPYTPLLVSAFSSASGSGLASNDQVRSAINQFQSTVSTIPSISPPHKAAFGDFAKSVKEQ